VLPGFLHPQFDALSVQTVTITHSRPTSGKVNSRTFYGINVGYYGLVIGYGVLVLLIVALTRGRLGYQRYQQQEEDEEPELAPATT
jgi:uncharacterized membrane protein